MIYAGMMMDDEPLLYNLISLNTARRLCIYILFHLIDVCGRKKYI